MERNVPKMRFKDFDDEWKEIKIGETLKIKHGKDQKNVVVDIGKYPILGTGGEIGRTNTPLYTNESVLIGRKGTIDKPMYMNTPFWTVDTLFYSEVKSDFCAKFIFYNFQRINWKKYCEASGVPSLSASTIESIKYKTPSLQEQEKIANFLTKVDSLIEEQDGKVKDLELYKKGMMQKIFSQEIRFKDDNGCEYPEWEEKKLGDISNKISDGIHATPVYSENSDIKFINGNNLKQHKIITSSTTKCINENEFKKYNIELSNHTILMSINGTIGNIAYYNNEKVLLGKSVAYININLKLVNKLFIGYILETEKTQRYFNNELTGTTIKNLSLRSIKETIIKVPCLKEQTKIANFLSNIDLIIEEENNKLEDLRQWKKGLLQQMFV